MKKMVNVAILSRWHLHADIYYRQAMANPNVNLVCVWDEDPVRGKKWAEEINVEFVADLDALLAREDIDAVAVTNPTSMHKDVMVKSARAGKHILSEKVTTPTVAEILEVQEAVEKSGVKFVLASPYKTQPEYLFAKKVVEQKWLGEITGMRLRSAHDGAVRDYLPEGFYSAEEAAGGAMVDLGAHPMYMVAWLLGEPVSVTSLFTSVTGRGVEDNAVSLVEFPGEAIAVVETSFAAFPKVRWMDLSGTKGSLRINGPMEPLSSLPIEVEIYLKNENGIEGWVKVEDLPEELPSPFDQWIDSIANDTRIEYDFATALVLTQINEGAYLSAREGRKIYIGEVMDKAKSGLYTG